MGRGKPPGQEGSGPLKAPGGELGKGREQSSRAAGKRPSPFENKTGPQTERADEGTKWTFRLDMRRAESRRRNLRDVRERAEQGSRCIPRGCVDRPEDARTRGRGAMCRDCAS